MDYDSDISIWMWQIIAPIILLLGTTGNVLTIFVLTQSRTRKSSTAVYLAALAVSDLIVIDIGLLRQWIIHVGGVDFRLLSDITCKLHWFLIYSFTEISSWLLVTVTCERLFGILWPHRVRVLCRPRSAYVVVTIVVISLSILSSHLLYGVSVQNVNTTKGSESNETILQSINLSAFEKSDHGTSSSSSQLKCGIYGSTDAMYNYFFKFIFPWIDLLVYGLIPSVILTVADILIIQRLIASRKLRLRMLNNSGVDRKLIDRSTSVSVMLVTVSVVFVLCTSPMSCFLIILPYWIYNGTDISEDQQIFGTSVTLLMYLNHAINFLLYAASGSSFRKKASDLFKKNATPSSLFSLTSKGLNLTNHISSTKSQNVVSAVTV